MSNKETILNLVLESTCHPTADDIYQNLRASGKKITLATVYNNLHALCKEGRIRSLSLDEKSERYDKPLRHDHMICRKCMRIKDVMLTDLTKRIEEETGCTIESYDLKIHYLCEDCQTTGTVS